MREVTEKKKLEILSLFLEGNPYDEISTMTGVAKGTVVNIVNEFRAGRFPTFADVGDLVDTLRELSVDLRKRRVGVSEALLGLTFFSRLDKMGVKPADLWAWTDMCRELSPADGPLEEFTGAALELFRLERETGESYPSLAVSCSTLRAEAEDLASEVEGLKKEKGELQTTNSALAKERQGLEEEKRALEKDVAELSPRRERLRHEVAELEGKRSALAEEARELEATAEGLRPEVDALQGLGFGKEELEMLRGKLEEVASSHGLTAEGLRTKFFEDLAEYGAIIGFQEKREGLQEEVARLEAHKEHLERIASRLGAPPEEVEQAVRSLLSLKRKQVRPSAVVSYCSVLSGADMEPEELEKAVLELGGLRKTIASCTEELKGLEEEKGERTRVVEVLQAEEAAIKATIRELGESGRRAIEEARVTALREVEKASQKMAKEIAEWGVARGELGAYLEDLKRARYFTSLPLSAEALEAFTEDMGPVIVGQYLQMAALWCSKKLNPRLKPPRWITGKYYRVGEYTDVEVVDLMRWALEAFLEGVAGNGRGA